MADSINITPSNSDFDDKSAIISPEGQFPDSWVKEPTVNDVLCGRGGNINSHPGNERFRTLVEKRKRIYLTARFKREKRLIASSIVSDIRALDPPGRFLTRDNKTGKWKDIGDEKARDKTSQALRENAPTIRAEIETEINVQRAEMQRAEDEEEEEEEETGSSPHQPPPPAYGTQGWGYPAYYGHAPPVYGHPPPPYMGFWGHAPAHYPPPMTHPSPYTQATTSAPYPPPPPKSALEQTADLVMSGAESIKEWTQKSFSFGGGSLQPANSSDSHSRSDIASKPIVYVHEDFTKKRRMVKFREDQSFASSTGRRRPTKRHNTNTSLTGNSLMDGEDVDEDMEPHDLETTPSANGGLINTFANNIFNSMGSWDAVSIVCGHENSGGRMPFPRSSDHPDETEGMEHVPEEELVEWEGQEVQLMDNRLDCDSSRDTNVDAMPPPSRRQAYQENSSVGFSSLGSCHSWLPDQISATASFFGGASRGGDSMDMDYSTGGTENYSVNGSLGGNSLTKVFEHEPLDEGLQSPNMTHQALDQMPSWERNVRSRSPLSVGDDDVSLISKTSSKISDNGLSSFRGDSMNWESRE